MKIGILTRELTLDSKAKINGIPSAYLNILNSNIYPVFINSNLILNNKNREQLLEEIKDMNGFILPGGNEISEVDLFIIDYCYKNNIPLLGICLGMQEIGYYFNNKVIKKLNTNKHFNTDLEYVLEGNNIKENIIVKEKSDSYEYNFLFELKGLKVRLSEIGRAHV